MDRVGILDILFPEIRDMKEEGRTGICGADAWKQVLVHLRALEALRASKEDHFGRYAGELENYLAEEVTQGRKKAALIKLAAIFSVDASAGASGTGILDGCSARLKLSRKEAAFLRMIPGRLRELNFLLNVDRISRRDAILFFSRNESDFLALFLLYLGRVAAFRTSGLRSEERKVLKMLQKYERDIRPALQSPPLIDGRDLMDFFEIKPGPVIGKVLRALREAQLEGVIGNRRQALALAGELLKKQDAGKTDHHFPLS
jgi:poly(A) polymerase